MKKLKIVVTEPNYIGDVLMSTPALRLLRESYPEAEIIVVTTEQGREALGNNPNIDAFIIRNRRINLSDRINLIRKVRNLNPDYVLLLRSTFFYALLSYLSKAKKRLGIETFFRKPLLTKSIRFDVNRLYRREFTDVVCLAADKEIVVADEKLYNLDFNIPESDRNYIRDLLAANKLDSSKKIVVISPGTTRPAKLWQPKKYAVIIDRLFEKNYSVILTGTEIDTIIFGIIKYTKEAPVILTDLKLTQYAELIRTADLFISSDTGGFYISIAVDTSSICLFGSTYPFRYGPFDMKKQRIIYRYLYCSPCGRRVCPRTKSMESPCMEAITVDDILRKIEYFKR